MTWERIRMKQLPFRIAAFPGLAAVGCLCMVLAQEGPQIPPLRTASLRTSPTVPSVKDSPISHIRNLLAAAPEQRKDLLDQHTPTTRAFWERKVTEYAAMDEDERDRRLRDAQLHWYLMLILRTPSDQREVKLLELPETERGLISDRVREWEDLPNDLQMDIMTHLPALKYVGQLASLSPGDREKALAEAKKNGTGAEYLSVGWSTLDVERRRAMFLGYQKFFTLEQRRQEKVLAKIPMPQRQTLQSRLEQLENLSPDVRQKCLDALQKYAHMTPEERILFRATAERWKQMEPAEHDVWRKVVTRIPPIPSVRVRTLPPIPGSGNDDGLPPLPDKL